MKRTILTIALTMMMSAVVISGVMAQQQQMAPQPNAPMSSTPKAAAPEKEKLDRFAGTLSRVNAATKEIAVTKDSKEMTFAWSDTTKFTEGKKDLSFTDLKEGMKVTIQYKKEGEKYMAAKVNVKHAKSAAKKSHSEKSY